MTEPTLGSSISRASENERFAGLYGWVLMPAVVIVINLLVLIWGCASGAVALFSTPNPETVAGECLQILLALFVAFTLYSYLKTKRRTRILVFILFGMMLALTFLEFGYYISVGGTAISPGGFGAVIRIAIFSWVIFYFATSDRVKATFVSQ